MGRVATLQRNGVESRINILGDMWHHVRICCIGRGCCCGVYRELSAPSVVSAEATWYGSLRAGIGSIALDEQGKPTNKAETKFNDAGSRFGIKGSSEISEGLTAVYNFEHKINTANASLAGGGRLSYAGLSGGFGKITAGQIWSASYNSVGAITDNSTLFGSSETSARHGNVISYANTFGPASVQLDLMFDGGRDTGKDIDQVDFGLTVELGDIGKIAIAHINKKDSMPGTLTSYTVDIIKHTLTDGTLHYSPKFWAEKEKKPYATTGTAMTLTVKPVAITVKDGQMLTMRSMYGNFEAPTVMCNRIDKTATDACITDPKYSKYVSIEKYPDDATPAVVDPATAGTKSIEFTPNDVNLKDGSTSNHIAAEFSFGGVTPYIGYAQKKMEKAHGKSVKDKTTFFGVRGSLGDTGLSYLFQYRDKENADGTKPEPWILGLSKTLGGGASLNFEHGDPGEKNKKSSSAVWLKVDF